MSRLGSFESLFNCPYKKNDIADSAVFFFVKLIVNNMQGSGTTVYSS